MAKVVIEVDTETKESSFSIDGQPVDAVEYAIGRYVSPECHTADGKPRDKVSTYISFTKADGNTRYSTNISFDNLQQDTYSYTVTNYSLAKEMGKIHKNAAIAHMIGKSLGKRTPVATVDLATENQYMQDRPVSASESEE